jgi:hypothetical protein
MPLRSSAAQFSSKPSPVLLELGISEKLSIQTGAPAELLF